MIFLGLGSNLPSKFGDRFKNIEKAIFYLQNLNINVVKKSSFYETLSYPDISKPKFINVVIAISANIEANKLAEKIISIENLLERKRNYKNEPRTCDIDIIDYMKKSINFIFNGLKFQVPHNELSNRNFVLFPLREIEPNWTHPTTKVKIDDLIKNLSPEDRKSILKLDKNWYKC